MKKILIYHPSNKRFDIVKVKYFGEHLYTRGDVKASNLNRSFFYFKQYCPERRFRTRQYSYVVEVVKNRLYDLRTDKQNLIDKFVTTKHDIDGMLRYIKKSYLGAIYDLGEYNIITIFYDIVPVRVVDMWKKYKTGRRCRRRKR